MKRKFLASIAALIVVSSTTFLPASTFFVSTFGARTAHAQATPATTTPPSTNPSTTAAPEPSSSQTATTPSVVDNSTPSGEIQCNSWYGNLSLCGLVKLINLLTVGVSMVIANLSGLLLDFTMHMSISSGTYSNDTVNAFLVQGWKLVRDFSTIFLLFALLVVVFMLIFNADGQDGSIAANFSPGRTIARVLIVALLVNFSFLGCRIVIEIGNVLANTIYNQTGKDNSAVQNYSTDGAPAYTDGIGNSSEVFKGSTYIGIHSISAGLLANINPQKILLSSSFNGEKDGENTWKLYFTYLLLGFVTLGINLILIFTFVSMTVLFIGRMIGLYMAIILSPFALVSWTTPWLQKIPFIGFDNWFKDLIGLTFLAPVYVFFVYLSVAFTKIKPPTGSSTILATALFAVLSALLSLFVLLRGKKISESMAGSFGEFVGSIAGKVAGLGVMAATAGTGILASQTIGRTGSAIASSGALRRLQDSKPSDDIDSVDRRTKRAAAFRNMSIGKYNIGNSALGRRFADRIERGDTMANLKSGFGRATRTLGKNMATRGNPLDRTIFGQSVRGLSGAFATKAAGTRTAIDKNGKMVEVKDDRFEKAVNKGFDAEAAAKQAAIKSRALDIKSTKTVTNASNNAVSAGLANFAQSSNPGTQNPSSGNQPPNPGPQNQNPPNNTPPPGGGGTGSISNNTPPTPTPATRPPVPPTRQQPQPSATTAGGTEFARSKNLFTGNVNFDRPSAPSEILDSSGQPLSKTITQTPIIVDASGNPITAPKTAVESVSETQPAQPTTQSGSNATEFLSGIQSALERIEHSIKDSSAVAAEQAETSIKKQEDMSDSLKGIQKQNMSPLRNQNRFKK